MQPIATDVARSVVCVSVCVLFTLMYCAKTAEPIEMPFCGLTHLGPRYNVLDGCRDIPTGRGNFRGCSVHNKAKRVSAVVYAAKGIIQLSIMACSERDHSILIKGKMWSFVTIL